MQSRDEYNKFHPDLISALYPMETVRIDKWLWAARFFKTRSLATTAVDSGKVKVGGDKVKPSRSIRLGEVLDINNGSTEWQVVVEGLSDVRRGAPEAQALYRETEASITHRAQEAERRKYFREPSADIKGRPTKRDRRNIDRSYS